jgi:hypothetical protein
MVDAGSANSSLQSSTVHIISHQEAHQPVGLMHAIALRN